MRFIAVGLLAFALCGCRTLSVTAEYDMTIAPNNHGQYVPTYNTKLVIRN